MSGCKTTLGVYLGKKLCVVGCLLAFVFVLANPVWSVPQTDLSRKEASQKVVNFVSEGDRCALQGKIDSSLHYYFQAISLEPFLAREESSNLLFHFSEKLFEAGATEIALEYAKKSLSIKLAEHNPSAFMSFGQIATIFMKDGEMDSALVYFRKQLEESEAGMNGKVASFNNLGVIYIKTAQFDSATYYFEAALARGLVGGEGNKQDSLELTYCIRDNIAFLKANEGSYQKALALYQQNIELTRLFSDPLNIEVQAEIGVTKMLLKLGRMGEAKKQLTGIEGKLNALERYSRLKYTRKYLELCAQYYHQAGNEKEELVCHKRLIQCIDSIQEQNKELYDRTASSLANKKVNVLMHDLRVQEQNLAQKEEKLQLIREKARLNFWAIIFFISVGVLILILLTLWFRKRTQEQKKQQELLMVRSQLAEAELGQKTKEEKLLKETKRELESSNAELRRFARLVSHDLKGPLRGIGSLTGMLKRSIQDGDGEASIEQLSLIKQRVLRMDSFIEGLLEYSKVGFDKTKNEAINLEELIAQIMTVLPNQHGVEVTFSGTHSEIVGKRVLIAQIFQNLIENAIKFMDKQEGRVAIRCEANASHWIIRVSDNGCGIEDKYFKKVFEIFQTLQIRDVVESTGLGLSLVKKIVELHGGTIQVESKLKEGTCFIFTISKGDEAEDNALKQFELAPQEVAPSRSNN